MVGQLNVFDTWFTCDTQNITPENCAPEYGLQISAVDAPNSAFLNNNIQDVCVSAIMVNGREVPVVPKRVGDNGKTGPNADSVEHVNFRYYDLPNAPNSLPDANNPGTSTIESTAEPACGPLPGIILNISVTSTVTYI